MNNLFKADYVQMCIEWTYSQPSHYRIGYGSLWYLVKSKPLRFLSLPYLRGPFIPLFSNQTSPLTAPTSIHKASPQNSKRIKKFQMLHSSDCFFFPEFSRTPKKLHSKLLSRLSVECVEILEICLIPGICSVPLTLWPQTFYPQKKYEVSRISNCERFWKFMSQTCTSKYKVAKICCFFFFLRLC